MEQLKDYVQTILILLIVYLVGILNIFYVPEWKGPEILKNNFPLFSLSLVAVILIISIGGFLLRRWKITGKENITTLIWALSFFVYVLTFIGLILKSLGVSWANTGIPLFFFIYRQPMILFIAGIYYGIIRILTKSKFWRGYITTLIIISSYMWFIYGLFIKGNIELTMHGFLSFIFIPVCFFVASLFYIYGNNEKLKPMKFLGLGFAFLGLTYMGWAPWHKDYFYFIMYTLFILSLVLILISFIYLSFNNIIKKKGD